MAWRSAVLTRRVRNAHLSTISVDHLLCLLGLRADADQHADERDRIQYVQCQGIYSLVRTLSADLSCLRSWIRCSVCACRQLEILHNSDTGAEHGSLLWLLDHTMTVFGGRLLRSWVAHPLRDAALIQERLDAVQELADAKSERPGPPLSAVDFVMAF